MKTTPVKKVPIHLQSAQNRLLIKNGTVINDDGSDKVDVYVEDNVIRMVGKHLIIPGGTRIIDAAGKFLLPGGIDANVHLQMPTTTEGTSVAGGTRTIDDFYQGTKAALSGGTTFVIDCVLPEKEESLIDAYNKWRGWADEMVCCDYALRVAVNKPVEGALQRDMEELSGAEFGVNTFWFDMESKGSRMSDTELMNAFAECAKLGCLAQVHAESGDIVERNAAQILQMGVTGPEGFFMAHSEAAEEEATMRATALASQVNCPIYITSVSSAGAAEIVRAKKSRGNVVYAETTPASLACDGEEYFNSCWRHAAAFVTRPPIRKDQMEQLLNATVGDNDGEAALDIVSSNHMTYNSSQKALGLRDFTKIPPGVNGIESRLSILWEKGVHSGKMTPERFVALTSSNPAKVFNVYPEKGKIAVGSHADIVIWNPAASKTISKENHNLKTDFNIFEGMTCHGVPETVIVQGRVVVDECNLRAMQGLGKFVPLPTFAPIVFEKVRAREAAAVELRTMRPVVRSGEKSLF